MILFRVLAFTLGSVIAEGGLSGILQFDPSATDGIMQLITAKYQSMDHAAAMRDFKEDNKNIQIFKMYFDYCDEGKDGILTPEDDAACTEKLKAHLAGCVIYLF